MNKLKPSIILCVWTFLLTQSALAQPPLTLKYDSASTPTEPIHSPTADQIKKIKDSYSRLLDAMELLDAPSSCSPTLPQVMDQRAEPFSQAYAIIREKLTSGECKPEQTVLLFEGDGVLYDSGADNHLPPFFVGHSTPRHPSSPQLLRRIRDLGVKTLLISKESAIISPHTPYAHLKAMRKALPDTVALTESKDLRSKIFALKILYQKGVYYFGKDYLKRFLLPEEALRFAEITEETLLTESARSPWVTRMDSLFYYEYSGVFPDLGFYPSHLESMRSSRSGSPSTLSLGELPTPLTPASGISLLPATPSSRSSPQVGTPLSPSPLVSRFFDHHGEPSQTGFFILNDDDLSYDSASHHLTIARSRAAPAEPVSLSKIAPLDERGLMYYDESILLTSGIQPHEAFKKVIQNQGRENDYQCVFSISQEPNPITDLSHARSLYPKLKTMTHIQVNAF